MGLFLGGFIIGRITASEIWGLLSYELIIIWEGLSEFYGILLLRRALIRLVTGGIFSRKCTVLLQTVVFTYHWTVEEFVVPTEYK